MRATHRPLNYAILLLAIFASLYSGSANAQSVTTEPNLSRMPAAPSLVPINGTALTASVGAPSTFVVPITVDNITGLNVGSYQFNILFDPAVINPSGSNFGCSTAGTLTQAGGLAAVCNVSPRGTLRVAAFGAGTMTGSGSILKVTFATTAGASPGNISPLTFASVSFFNDIGTVLPFTQHDGQITILGPTAAGVSVGGMVMNAAGDAVPNVRVTLTNTSGVTLAARSNGFGYYRFDDVRAGADYVISASSKRYLFAPQVISVTDQLLNVNLVASP